MVDVKTEVSGHQQLGVLLLRLAGQGCQGNFLSCVGERVGYGFAGLQVNGGDDIGTGDVWLSVFPDHVVLIFEPVFQLIAAAVHGNGTPIVAALVAVLLGGDDAAAQLVAAERIQELFDKVLAGLSGLPQQLAGSITLAEGAGNNGLPGGLAVQRHAGLSGQAVASHADQLAQMLHGAGINGLLDDALVAPLVNGGHGGQAVTVIVVGNLHDLRDGAACVVAVHSDHAQLSGGSHGGGGIGSGQLNRHHHVKLLPRVLLQGQNSLCHAVALQVHAGFRSHLIGGHLLDSRLIMGSDGAHQERADADRAVRNIRNVHPADLPARVQLVHQGFSAVCRKAAAAGGKKGTTADKILNLLLCG